jgi:tetratricopeptide (TPR) repeat protein
MGNTGPQKWIIIAVILIACVIAVFAILRSPYKIKTTAEKDSLRGPIADSEVTKMPPLESEALTRENPEELAALGDRYFENSRFAQAIKFYEKVLQLNPKDVDTYNDMGLALHYTGQTERALAILRKGANGNPSFQRIWLSLGFVLASTGKDEEAKEVLSKALELDPSSEQGREAKRILGVLK